MHKEAMVTPICLILATQCQIKHRTNSKSNHTHAISYIDLISSVAILKIVAITPELYNQHKKCTLKG